jgi:Tol biopolymer transport system component
LAASCLLIDNAAAVRLGERGDAMNRRRALVLAGILLTAGFAAAGSDATTPGPNGRIVYVRQVHGHSRLFTIQPDGTKETQITHGAADAMSPDWSPDGKLIAFGYETPPANGSVALISPQGNGLRLLTPTGAQPPPKGHIWNGNPAFTPDGQRIVFVRDQGPADGGIWIMRTDGSGLRRLTRNPFVRNWDGGDVAPAVSPDGKVVSFVRIKRAEKLQALFTVHIDGTGLKQLTSYGLEVAIKQDWSPDGRLIVITTNADFARPHDSANLMTMRPDGSHKNRLTKFTGRRQNAFAGSFSPDGKKIVFRLEQGDRYALAVVGRTGHNLRLVTRFDKSKRFLIDWGVRP